MERIKLPIPFRPETYDKISAFRMLTARRVDRDTARKVDQAIAIQSIQGTQDAAAFLTQHKVPFEVALRVLASTDERRLERIYR